MVLWSYIPVPGWFGSDEPLGGRGSGDRLKRANLGGPLGLHPCCACSPSANTNVLMAGMSFPDSTGSSRLTSGGALELLVGTASPGGTGHTQGSPPAPCWGRS